MLRSFSPYSTLVAQISFKQKPGVQFHIGSSHLGTSSLTVPLSSYYIVDWITSANNKVASKTLHTTSSCNIPLFLTMKSMGEKLQQFRAALKAHDIDAYIIPTDDAHGSEYPSRSDARREYMTEFTGSAGTAVITQDEALLWTDGR